MATVTAPAASSPLPTAATAANVLALSNAGAATTRTSQRRIDVTGSAGRNVEDGSEDGVVNRGVLVSDDMFGAMGATALPKGVAAAARAGGRWRPTKTTQRTLSTIEMPILRKKAEMLQGRKDLNPDAHHAGLRAKRDDHGSDGAAGGSGGGGANAADGMIGSTDLENAARESVNSLNTDSEDSSTNSRLERIDSHHAHSLADMRREHLMRVGRNILRAGEPDASLLSMDSALELRIIDLVTGEDPMQEGEENLENQERRRLEEEGRKAALGLVGVQRVMVEDRYNQIKEAFSIKVRELGVSTNALVQETLVKFKEKWAKTSQENASIVEILTTEKLAQISRNHFLDLKEDAHNISVLREQQLKDLDRRLSDLEKDRAAAFSALVSRYSNQLKRLNYQRPIVIARMLQEECVTANLMILTNREAMQQYVAALRSINVDIDRKINEYLSTYGVYWNLARYEFVFENYVAAVKHAMDLDIAALYAGFQKQLEGGVSSQTNMIQTMSDIAIEHLSLQWLRSWRLKINESIQDQTKTISKFQDDLTEFETNMDAEAQRLVQYWFPSLEECETKPENEFRDVMQEQVTKFRKTAEIVAGKRAGMLLPSQASRNREVLDILAEFVVSLLAIKAEHAERMAEAELGVSSQLHDILEECDTEQRAIEKQLVREINAMRTETREASISKRLIKCHEYLKSMDECWSEAHVQCTGIVHGLADRVRAVQTAYRERIALMFRVDASLMDWPVVKAIEASDKQAASQIGASGTIYGSHEGVLDAIAATTHGSPPLSSIHSDNGKSRPNTAAKDATKQAIKRTPSAALIDVQSKAHSAGISAPKGNKVASSASLIAGAADRATSASTRAPPGSERSKHASQTGTSSVAASISPENISPKPTVPGTRTQKPAGINQTITTLSSLTSVSQQQGVKSSTNLSATSLQQLAPRGLPVVREVEFLSKKVAEWRQEQIQMLKTRAAQVEAEAQAAKLKRQQNKGKHAKGVATTTTTAAVTGAATSALATTTKTKGGADTSVSHTYKPVLLDGTEYVPSFKATQHLSDAGFEPDLAMIRYVTDLPKDHDVNAAEEQQEQQQKDNLVVEIPQIASEALRKLREHLEQAAIQDCRDWESTVTARVASKIAHKTESLSTARSRRLIDYESQLFKVDTIARNRVESLVHLRTAHENEANFLMFKVNKVRSNYAEGIRKLVVISHEFTDTVISSMVTKMDKAVSANTVRALQHDFEHELMHHTVSLKECLSITTDKFERGKSMLIKSKMPGHHAAAWLILREAHIIDADNISQEMEKWRSAFDVEIEAVQTDTASKVHQMALEFNAYLEDFDLIERVGKFMADLRLKLKSGWAQIKAMHVTITDHVKQSEMDRNTRDGTWINVLHAIDMAEQIRVLMFEYLNYLGCLKHGVDVASLCTRRMMDMDAWREVKSLIKVPTRPSSAQSGSQSEKSSPPSSQENTTASRTRLSGASTGTKTADNGAPIGSSGIARSDIDADGMETSVPKPETGRANTAHGSRPASSGIKKMDGSRPGTAGTRRGSVLGSAGSRQSSRVAFSAAEDNAEAIPTEPSPEVLAASSMAHESRGSVASGSHGRPSPPGSARAQAEEAARYTGIYDKWRHDTREVILENCEIYYEHKTEKEIRKKDSIPPNSVQYMTRTDQILDKITHKAELWRLNQIIASKSTIESVHVEFGAITSYVHDNVVKQAMDSVASVWHEHASVFAQTRTEVYQRKHACEWNLKLSLGHPRWSAEMAQLDVSARRSLVDMRACVDTLERACCDGLEKTAKLFVDQLEYVTYVLANVFDGTLVLDDDIFVPEKVVDETESGTVASVNTASTIFKSTGRSLHSIADGDRRNKHSQQHLVSNAHVNAAASKTTSRFNVTHSSVGIASQSLGQQSASLVDTALSNATPGASHGGVNATTSTNGAVATLAKRTPVKKTTEWPPLPTHQIPFASFHPDAFTPQVLETRSTALHANLIASRDTAFATYTTELNRRIRLLTEHVRVERAAEDQWESRWTEDIARVKAAY